MNVYLIKASAPGPFKEYKKAMGAPPQNIFSVAAATPDGVGIEMCDETIGMKPFLKTRADIVALFFHTPDAVHAYKLAEKFRARGKTVVLGGLHPTALPDEAANHGDAVLVGEAEGIWGNLLDDHKNQTLKRVYRRDEPVDLAHVNPYPTNIIPPSKYGHLWSILVSRGCVHRCEYCAVPPFFRGNYRLRPIDDIVAEIKAAPTDWFELHANNLTADREYALKLFTALKPLNIKWFGESTIKMADDAQLLRAAADSGCKEFLIGIETSSRGALKNSGKGFVDPDTTREKIRIFHEHGIKVISPIIFGFDSHTPDIFEESEAFVRHIGIDEIQPVLLIPFPGTPLYERLNSENRILSRDRSLYDGNNGVFQPANMTAEELEEGTERFWKEIRKKKASAGGSRDKPGSGSNGFGALGGGPALSSGGSTLRWKSMLALGLIGTGIWFDWYWIWGLLALIWGITDLRNRHTYLLEDIPRSESPILYWIVVLMWLLLGIWALSTSPVFASREGAPKPGISSSGQGESPALNSRTAGGKKPLPAREGESVKNCRQVKDQRFGFTFEGPETWKSFKESDPSSVTLHLRQADESAGVTAVAVDYQETLSLNTFMGDMEAELRPELGLDKSTRSSTTIKPIPLGKQGARMVFRQYDGHYGGEKLTIRVGYAVKKSRGYAMVGVCGATDRQNELIVSRILSSFKLTNTF